MRRLPLYEAPLPTPLETGRALPLEVGTCHRCVLGVRAVGKGQKPCVGPRRVEGPEPARGTVLVIGDHPTRYEAEDGRPMISDAGRALHRVLKKYWPGSYVVDTAVRCAPHKGEDYAAGQAACAPYTRQVFAEAKPDRIIVLGRQAAKSVLGRDVNPIETRKGYSWVRRPDGALIPLMVLSHPIAALSNQHVLRDLEEDFAWALGDALDGLMPPPYDHYFHIVENAADARDACARIRESEWASYDCETGGKHFSDYFEVRSLALTTEDEETYVWGRQAMKDPAAVAILLDLLEDEAIGKVGANTKYDQLSVRAAWGIVPQGNVLDVQLSRHLDLPGCAARLEVLSELVGMGGYKQDFALKLAATRESIRHARKKSKGGRQLQLLPEDPALLAAINHPDEDVDTYAYALIPSPDLERYNARDTVCTTRVAKSRVGFALVQKHPAHRNVWRNLLCRTTDAVEQIEAWGIGVNVEAVEHFNRYVEMQLEPINRRIDRYGVNPKSPPQVAAFLFDKLKLRNPQDPKSRSTDKKALKAMAGQHDFIDDLREHRRLSKLRDAYGNLPAFVRSDGRIHPSFKIDGTETGRLSCVEPGLHQIPRSKDGEGHSEGKLIKDCFVAAPGYRLVQLDESQLELRTAAALSLDQVMISIFLSGKDFHFQTAQRIAPLMWKMRPEDVTDAQRSAAKTFVFGLIYGMTDPGLAARLNCSIRDAERLRAAVLGEFAGLARWITECKTYARTHGHIVTPFLWQPGRIRQLPNIALPEHEQKTRGLKRTAENGSFNTPCQSLGSDIVLSALCEIVDVCRSDPTLDARVVLTVHDSIVAEVREDHVDRYISIARPIMTQYDLRGVPLVVDVELGEAYGSLQKQAALARAA